MGYTTFHEESGRAYLSIARPKQTIKDLFRAEIYLFETYHDITDMYWCNIKPEDERNLRVAIASCKDLLSPDEKLQKLREIVSSKTFGWVGKTQVDLYTAQCILKVHDTLSNDDLKRKYMSWPISKMAEFAYKFF